MMNEQKAREKYSPTIELMRKWVENPARYSPDKSHEAVVALADENIALEAKLFKMEEALGAANFESLSGDATAASVMLVIREALAGGEEA